MDRRTFISVASGAVVGGMSGCIEPEESSLSVGDTIQEQGASFTVTEFDVQQSVVYQGTVHPIVRNETGQQYLLFGVDVVNNSEDVESKIRGQFALSVGDDDGVVEEIDNRRISTRNQAGFPHDFYLLYPVSRDIPVEDATLRFSGSNKRYNWSIRKLVESADLRNYVQNPPNPTVESVEIPDSVSRQSETVPTTVSITSDGETDNPVTEPLKMLLSSTKTTKRTPVTAYHQRGQTTTHNFEVPIYPNQGPRKETIRLNSGTKTLSKTVEITE